MKSEDISKLLSESCIRFQGVAEMLRVLYMLVLLVEVVELKLLTAGLSKHCGLVRWVDAEQESVVHSECSR